MEIWKDIQEYEGLYQVSNFGRIKSFRNNRAKISFGFPNKAGYRITFLCNGGVAKNRYIHRLVGMAFIPNPNGYLYINHLNGCKDNNVYTNLEWCTASQNHIHAFKLKLRAYTPHDDHRSHKLNESDVLAIRRLLQQGEKQTIIGKMFNVTTGAIHHIHTRRNWKHIA